MMRMMNKIESRKETTQENIQVEMEIESDSVRVKLQQLKLADREMEEKTKEVLIEASIIL